MFDPASSDLIERWPHESAAPRVDLPRSLACPANKEANVFVAGIDAHTRYVVVVVVNKTGERVLGPVRVNVDAPERLVVLLAPYRPLEAVVETSSSWPWLDETLSAVGVRFVLAHAKRLRAIAEANYKRDGVDAELLRSEERR